MLIEQKILEGLRKIDDKIKPNKPSDYLRLPYSRLLVSDEETGHFIARIIEFPGCFAEGETSEEAAHNLEMAAESWLMAVIESGQHVPEPAGDKEYSGKFALRLPRSLHKICAFYAQQEGVSLNQFIVYVLSKYKGCLTK